MFHEPEISVFSPINLLNHYQDVLAKEHRFNFLTENPTFISLEKNTRSYLIYQNNNKSQNRDPRVIKNVLSYIGTSDFLEAK